MTDHHRWNHLDGDCSAPFHPTTIPPTTVNLMHSPEFGIANLSPAGLGIDSELFRFETVFHCRRIVLDRLQFPTSADDRTPGLAIVRVHASGEFFQRFTPAFPLYLSCGKHGNLIMFCGLYTWLLLTTKEIWCLRILHTVCRYAPKLLHPGDFLPIVIMYS